jgi:hypothetical protein
MEDRAPLTVWEYWEGPMPAWIELCIETVRRHHPAMQLLDPAAFDEVWETDRDIRIDHIGPYYRSAFIRVYLLRHFGGLWIDTDFILLRPFDDLTTLPSSVTFAGYRVDGLEFANGLLYSRVGDPVIGDMYSRVCSVLRAGGPLHWGQLGWESLKHAVEAHPGAVHAIDEHDVSPIPWYEAHRFEQPGDVDGLVARARYGVMLANASASDELGCATRDAVLTGGSLLGELLLQALDGPPKAWSR